MADGQLISDGQSDESEFEQLASNISQGTYSPQGQAYDVKQAIADYLAVNYTSDHPSDIATAESYLQDRLGSQNAALVSAYFDGLFATHTIQFDPAEITASPQPQAGEPVNLATGQFVLQVKDFAVSGAGIDFVFSRTYRSGAIYAGPLGPGWDHAYNLWLTDNGDNSVTVTTGRLKPVTYFLHQNFPYYVAVGVNDIVVATADDAFERRSPAGVVARFEQLGAAGGIYQLVRITDRFSNVLSFQYDGENRLGLVTVNNPARTVQFVYDDQSRIAAVTLFPVTCMTNARDALVQRRWTYCYDDFGDLIAVAGPPTDEFPSGRTTRYAYSSSSSFAVRPHDLLRVTDPNGTTYLENEYGDEPGTVALGKVVRHCVGDGVFLFDYAKIIADPDWTFTDAKRPASRVTVVQRDGHPVRYVLNAMGNVLAAHETILADGEVDVLWRYAYDDDGRLIATLSPEGRLTQTYYGREDFYRRQLAPGDPSLPMWQDPNLSPGEHARFANVIAVVRRQAPLALAGSLDNLAVYGDIFPPAVTVASDDIVVKYSHEDRFQQRAAISDPRYTSSPDPAAPESQAYAPHLTVTTFNADPGATPAAVTYPDTTYPDGTTGVIGAQTTFDAYDANGRLLQWTDPAGNVSRNEYVTAGSAGAATIGFLAARTAAVGVFDLKTSFALNEAGEVIATTNPNGNTTRRSLDACSLVRALFLPIAGYQVTSSYDGNAQVVSRNAAIIDADGSMVAGSPEVTSFAYNDLMSPVLKSFGDSSGAPTRQTRYIYDSSNRLIRTLMPRGNSVCYEYDVRSLRTRLICGCCTPDAALTGYSYDRDGLLVATIDPRGNATKTKRDAFGRAIGITDPLGTLQRVDYDKLNNPVVKRWFAASVNGAYTLLRRTEYDYDERGRLTRERKALYTDPILVADPWGAPDTEFAAAAAGGKVSWCDTLIYRDANCRATRTVDANGHATETEYDAANRRVATTDPAGNSQRLTYDAAGNIVRRDRYLVDAGGALRAVISTAYEYDPLNRLIAITDGAGNRVVRGLDSRGLLRSVTDALGHATWYGYDRFRNKIVDTQVLLPPTGAGIVEITTSRSYDSNGNIIALTDPVGNSTSFAYDQIDRLARVTNPDGSTRTMSYDPASNLIEQTDEDGVIVARRYDPMNRLSAFTVRENGSPVASAEQSAQFSYNGLGMLTGHANAFLAVDRSCNSLGQCYQETLIFGHELDATASPRTIARSFDKASNRTGLRYPAGQTLRYDFGPNNRFLRLSSTANAAGYPGDRAAAIGRSIVQRRWWGDLRVYAQLGNGATIASSYDAAGRRIADECALAAGSYLLQQLWDGAGNRKVSIEGYSAGLQGWWHGYDSTNRLTASASLSSPSPLPTALLAPPNAPLPLPALRCQQAIDSIINGLGIVPPRQPELGYDGAGNRVGQRGRATTTTYVSNVRNEYVRVGRASLVYDRAGHLLGDARFAFSYNFRGQLVQAAASGKTVLQVFHDALGRPVGIIDGARTRVLVLDGMDPIEVYDNGILSAAYMWEEPGRLCFAASQGTDQCVLRDVLESTRLTTTPSGAAIATFGYDAFGVPTRPRAALPILYSGKYFYGSIGWYEFGTRQYVAALGRFAQPDPAGFSDGANLYTFVGNNPLSMTDPSGTNRQSVARAATTEPLEGGTTKLLAQVPPQLENGATLPPADALSPAVPSPVALKFRSGAPADPVMPAGDPSNRAVEPSPAWVQDEFRAMAGVGREMLVDYLSHVAEGLDVYAAKDFARAAGYFHGGGTAKEVRHFANAELRAARNEIDALRRSVPGWLPGFDELVSVSEMIPQLEALAEVPGLLAAIMVGDPLDIIESAGKISLDLSPFGWIEPIAIPFWEFAKKNIDKGPTWEHYLTDPEHTRIP